MKEDTKEYTLDDLEDIIREYSSQRLPDLEKESADTGDTVRLDAVKPPEKAPSPTSDTKPLPDLDSDVRIYPGPKAKQKTTPPPRQAPILFPKNQAQELRQKLESGPEQRYRALTGKGFGRLQVGLFLSAFLFLGAAASTLLFYQVGENRLQMLILGQILVLILSALVGFRLLLEGVREMLHGRFRLNSLLAVTFLACLADGLCCLRSGLLPFGAVFCLQMLLAQWGEYLRLQTQISRLDTLRKAQELTAVVKSRKFYQGLCAYQTRPGDPESYDEAGEMPYPERLLCLYGLCAVVLSLVLAAATGVLYGFSHGVRTCAAALLAAAPASVFLAIARPEAVLEKKMHHLGLVLCGWKGLQTIEKRGVYPLEHRDLFPENLVKLNGVRFYGDRNPNTVVSYVAALTAADGGCLAAPFEQLRASRNARKIRVQELTSYPSGIGGQIDGMPVIAGTMDFMEKMGVELPEGAGIPHAVYAAINQSLCAVFAGSFGRSKSTAAGLNSLCQCRQVRPVLIDCDFVLSPDFLRQKLGLELRRMQFPNYLVRMELADKKPEPDAPVIALATKEGLAQRACAVTGGAALCSAWKAGTAVHLLGGGLGLLAVGILSLVGASALLAPYNLLLYGCVWMIPGLLISEWTQGI